MTDIESTCQALVDHGLDAKVLAAYVADHPDDAFARCLFELLDANGGYVGAGPGPRPRPVNDNPRVRGVQ